MEVSFSLCDFGRGEAGELNEVGGLNEMGELNEVGGLNEVLTCKAEMWRSKQRREKR